jgi:F-type H+-transporting ATPase subunit b
MAAPEPAAIAGTENAPDLVSPGGVFPPFDNHTFLSQIVWLVVVFGLLYWMMSRIALPRVGSILDARRGRIQGELADAHRMQKQAVEASAAYDAKLADAKSRAQALAQQTHEELMTANNARRHALEDDLNAKLAAAERQIEDTKGRAMGSVTGIARDAAAAIVEHLTGKAADPQAIDAAIAGSPVTRTS